MSFLKGQAVSFGSTRPGSKITGFTLIELLVVIVIISILAGLLFPVFAQAREKGRSIACTSNMREIGIAVMMYLQDYDDMYPQEHPTCSNPAVGNAPSGDYDGGLETVDYGSPFEKIMPYVSREDANLTSSEYQNLFVCPSDSDPHGALIGCTNNVTPNTFPQPGVLYNPPWPGVTSYLINAYFLFGLLDASVQTPANTIYVAERNDKFCDVHLHPWLGEVFDNSSDADPVNGTTPIPSCISANPGLDGEFAIQSNRHTAGANYIFADGHAKWEKYMATISSTDPTQACFGQYQALPEQPGP